MASTHPAELLPAFAAARRLHRKHGKSYYFASRFFPVDTRHATYALYAFFRVPDEIVDSSPSNTAADRAMTRSKLADWQDKWAKAYVARQSDDPILHVTAYVFHHYKIPYHYSTSFLKAMDQDLDKSSYVTYAELEQYMYGSAAVVGLMMTHVIGYTNPAALVFAEKLGYAMQLTNFLRDIDEDYVRRGRVYMPQSEMESFGITVADIESRTFSPRFKRFMKWQSSRAAKLYEESMHGIPLLDKTGRFPVRCATALYSAILSKLEQQDWNVFAGRARTSTGEKIRIAASTWKASYYEVKN